MEIQNTGKWNILEQKYFINDEKLKRIKDVKPELKERQIRRDSVDFSKEGMEALREQVQYMPGHIDVEERMRMEEILPKLRAMPSSDFLWAMRNDMQNSLNAIKQSKGSYTLDDLLSIRMKAYAKQYDALQKSYEDGTCETYVSDGIDESGKLQYHKVTLEEDLAFLDEAFGRITGSMVFSAKSQEIMWQIKEKFGGEKQTISLPKGYDKKLEDIMQRAASTYAEQKSNGNHADAAELVLKYLNEDAKYAEVMRKLYSNITPMPYN